MVKMRTSVSGENLRMWRVASTPLRGGMPANIEDRDVRFVLGGVVSSFAVVRGFGANFPAGMRFKERTQSRANYRVIMMAGELSSEKGRNITGVAQRTKDWKAREFPPTGNEALAVGADGLRDGFK